MSQKKNAKILVNLLILIISLTSLRTLAQNPPDHNIDSDSVFYITDSFLKTKAKSVLSNLLSHFDLKSANQNVGSNPTVQLNQIDVSITPAAYNITDSGDGLAFVATNNALHISIGEIGIHESIQRNVNGVIAIIRIDVSCTGAALSISDPQSTISSQLLPSVTGNFLQINFVNPIVHLVSPKMQLSGFKCTGATGFEALINSAIQSVLQDTTSANAFITQVLASNAVLLDKEFSFNWNAPRLVFGSTTTQADIQGWVMPNQISVTTTNDWQMTGVARVILPNLVSKETPYEKFTKWPLGIASNGGYAAIPEAAFLDLIKNYFAPGQWKHNDLANNFKGFSDLLKSGFLEFFLWSDLKKYPKNQIFPLTVTTIAPPQVAWVSPSSFSLNTTFLVQMMTNNRPYANFQVATQTVMNFTVANNELVVQAQKTKLNVTYKWAPSYCSSKCSTIDASVISKAMQAFLDTTKFTFAIPPLEFAGTAVNALSFLHDSESQTVILQLNPN